MCWFFYSVSGTAKVPRYLPWDWRPKRPTSVHLEFHEGGDIANPLPSSSTAEASPGFVLHFILCSGVTLQRSSMHIPSKQLFSLISLSLSFLRLLHHHIESGKMVLVNLSAGQQWRCRHREQGCGHSGGRRRWAEWREDHGNTYTTVRRIASRWEFAVWIRGAQPRALWWAKGVERAADVREGQEARDIRTPLVDSFMYGRDQHNYPPTNNKYIF